MNCLNKVDVTAERYVGGIAGRSYDYGTIINCANTGDVTTTSSSSAYAGGIVGYSTAGSFIINCYNTGDITTVSVRAGGIAGYARSLTVLNCYNAGNVTGSDYIGGLLGYGSNSYLEDATLSNNYFLQTDTVNAGILASGGSASVSADQIDAVSAGELQAMASTLGSAFTADTGINGGYPILTWQATGVYPEPESDENVSVAAIEMVSNGEVTVTLNEALYYTALSAEDFSATISVDGADAEALVLTDISQNDTSAVLSFDALARDTSDHTVTVSVGYGDGEKKSGDFTLYADSDWLIYAQAPAVGDGSEESPYRIGTAEELAWFAALVNGRVGRRYAG